MEFRKVKLGDFIDTISDTTPIKKDLKKEIYYIVK